MMVDMSASFFNKKGVVHCIILHSCHAESAKHGDVQSVQTALSLEASGDETSDGCIRCRFRCASMARSDKAGR